MIPNVQITGAPDTHPEKPIYDAAQLAARQIDLSKLDVSEHHVRVFNMMSKGDREAYESLYVNLCRQAKEGKILIVSNTREVLQNPDGSTGWFKYLEWTRFDTSNILGIEKEPS